MEPPDLETALRTEIQALRDTLEHKEFLLKYYREALRAEREAGLKDLHKLQVEIKDLKIQMTRRSRLGSFFRYFVSTCRTLHANTHPRA